LGILKGLGPVLGISVAVVFFAAVTLLPALLVLAGRRGWIAPRRDLTRRLWRRSGIHIVRRPKAHLIASALVLIILAGCAGLAHYNYDERKSLPATVESSIGYAELDKHFPPNLIIPEYLVVESPHDLRTVKALADRLAEACAEYVHLEARRAWYEPGAAPTLADLHAERYRGIRPAFGYPACPDHSEKQKLVELLAADRIGLELTESFAMTPAASVNGLLLAHPDARYFAVGRIARDQVEDYAGRKGIPIAEAEHWLRPNLGYEPLASTK